jgi:hypothetical protein
MTPDMFGPADYVPIILNVFVPPSSSMSPDMFCSADYEPIILNVFKPLSS